MSDEVFEKLVRVLNTYSGRDKAMRTIYFGLVLVSTRINRAALAKHVLALAKQLSHARLVWRQLGSQLTLLNLSRKIPGDLEHSTDVQDTCLSSVITLLFGANSLAEFVAWLSDARILKFDASRWFRYSLYLWIAVLGVAIFKCFRRIFKNDSDKTRGDKLMLAASLADLLPALNSLSFVRFPFVASSKLSQSQSALLSFVASVIGFYKLF